MHDKSRCNAQQCVADSNCGDSAKGERCSVLKKEGVAGSRFVGLRPNSSRHSTQEAVLEAFNGFLRYDPLVPWQLPYTVPASQEHLC